MTQIVPGLVGQAHSLAKDTTNPKLAMVYTGLAVTVLAMMAFREVKHEIRDMLKAMDGRSR